jgi:hypothetical protein
MDTRIALAALAVGVLCAAGVPLGAPLWLWAIGAGAAVGLLVYAFLVRQEDDEEDDSGGKSNVEGSGSASQYIDSNVVNVTLNSERKS